MIYCVVPPDAGPEVLHALESQFGGKMSVKTIVDRRAGQADDSRYKDRRNLIIPRRLPLKQVHAAQGVRFEHRLASLTDKLVDHSVGILAPAAASGHSLAAAELYWRLYGRLRELIAIELGRRADETDVIVPVAFGTMLDTLATTSKTSIQIEAALRHAVATSVSAHLSYRLLAA